MKINLLSPSVYEIEDFITVEEQQEVLAYAKSLEESSWWSTDKKVSEFFNGNVDELKVWNTNLTKDQVRQTIIYNPTELDTTLELYYNF